MHHVPLLVFVETIQLTLVRILLNKQ